MGKRFRVSFSGKKIGALGLSSHLTTIEVDAEDRASAHDAAREILVSRGWYETHEHIHTYAVVEV